MEVDRGAPAQGAWAWAAWQVVDSGLPTGGFAHSLGLEAAVSLGLVVSSDGGRNGSGHGGRTAKGDAPACATGTPPLTLRRFIEAQLEAVAAFELPFVYEANHCSTSWQALDEIQAVRLFPNPAAYKASTAQGNAFLRVARNGLVTDPQGLEEVDRMYKMLSAGEAKAMFAPTFGVITRLLGIGPDQAQGMFLFMAARDMVSAAKRLSLIGPNAAAGLLNALTPELERLAHKYRNRPAEDAHQTFPIAETAQSCHSSLFRKLFLS
mmetsp:Transcript_569/g.1076  ORF Transcript_569/g.1076 Transcript_569/m.1076 type:complete len:265 (-) Transcript_569:1-795(-)